MSLITKPYTFTAGAVIIAAEHNSNFDTIYNDFNGNISNANLVSNAAIALSKLSLSDDVAFTGDVNFNNSATTDNIIDVIGNSLTTGYGLQISSTSTSTAARSLEMITNTSTAAVNTVGLTINNAGGPHIRFTGDPVFTASTDGDFWFNGTTLNFSNGVVTLPLTQTVSIQRNTISFGINDLSKTSTVSAVDTSNSMLVQVGEQNCDASNATSYWASLYLTNTTTITATRLTTGASTSVTFELISIA